MGPDFEGPGSEGDRATCADAIEQNPEAVAFFDLLDQEKEALYEGCNNISSLQATATLLNIKSTQNISGVGFDDMCGRFKDWLPADNKLPPSFDASKKKLKRLGLKFEKIHACHNECMLFYKESSNLHECTKCGESRYVQNVSGSTSRRVPRKVLHYLPIIPRLQRLFMSRKTVEYMSWWKFNPAPMGSMTHPSHGQAWKHVDDTYPEFAADPRNVRLGLCADGFSPFGYSSKTYSIWPIILTVYNLPPWL